MRRVVKLLLIAALLLPACRISTPEPVPARTLVPVPPLTLAALSNAEYHSPDWGTFRLLHGLYQRPPQNPGESSSAYTTRLLEPAAFGDLNSDGAPDAVVGLGTQNGGTGHFVELAAVLNRGGQPENVATLSLGDRVVIEAANIQAGIIYPRYACARTERRPVLPQPVGVLAIPLAARPPNPSRTIHFHWGSNEKPLTQWPLRRGISGGPALPD